MIVYIDMDDVLCDFSGAHAAALKENPAVKYPQSQYGFFTNLHPIDGGIEFVNELMHSNVYIPYILTAPSIQNPLCYTEKRVWIEKMFGLSFVSNLIICNNKALLRGDILIDDHESGKGQEQFKGRLIHFGSNRFPNWKAVKEELDGIAGNHPN